MTTPSTPLDLGRFELGEGPVWDARAGVLSWVDITPGHLHTWNLATGERARFEAGQQLGAAAPRANGGYVLALRDGIGVIDSVHDSSFTWISEGLPGDGMRFNDAKVDARGRLWAGSIRLDDSDRPGALYVIEPDGSWRVALENIPFPNGMGWSLDGSTMYLIDTESHHVLAMDIDLTCAEIGEPRVAVECGDSPGVPDGMAVDAHGDLWVARYGGGCIDHYTPDGTLVARHEVAAQQPTCPTFMGDGLDRLVVTTALQFLDDATPEDGSLIELVVPVRGMPTHTFGA